MFRTQKIAPGSSGTPDVILFEVNSSKQEIFLFDNNHLLPHNSAHVYNKTTDQVQIILNTICGATRAQTAEPQKLKGFSRWCRRQSSFFDANDDFSDADSRFVFTLRVLMMSTASTACKSEDNIKFLYIEFQCVFSWRCQYFLLMASKSHWQRQKWSCSREKWRSQRPTWKTLNLQIPYHLLNKLFEAKMAA